MPLMTDEAPSAGVPLYRVLDTDGDGTGTKNAVGNYASAAEIFFIQPPPGQVYFVRRMIVGLEDAGALDADDYGNGITLTNGIIIRLTSDNGETIDLTDGIPVKTNAGWRRLCYDGSPSTFGSGNNHFYVRWSFDRGGHHLKLDGDKGDRLEVVLNDDYSGLVSHYFRVEGMSVAH